MRSSKDIRTCFIIEHFTVVTHQEAGNVSM